VVIVKVISLSSLWNAFLWSVLYRVSNQLNIVRPQLFSISVFCWLTCIFSDLTIDLEMIFYL